VSKIETADLMIYAMSREIDNNNTVLHGVSSPLPILAMSLARKTHAPDMAFVSGAEGVDPDVERIYLSSFDPRQNRDAVAYFGLHEVFDLAQRGELDVMFLGSAQIDRYGNTTSALSEASTTPRCNFPEERHRLSSCRSRRKW